MPRFARIASCTAAMFAAVLCAAALPPSNAYAQSPTQAGSDTPQRLTRAQARDYARSLLEAKQYRAARAIAQGLLQADAQDFDALLVLSRAQAELGELDAGRDAAGRAWDQADSDGQKYLAAYTMAQALNAGGNYTRGQLWLRRAAEHSPEPMLKAIARTEFGRMRERNPLSVNLRFAIMPTSNLNNGSAEAWQPDDLPFAVQPSGSGLPLSGVAGSVGADLSYRLARHAQSETSALFGADYRSYALSSDAKRKAEDVSGADFAFGSVAIGLEHRGTLQPNTRDYRIAGRAGRSWYGGDGLYDFARLDAGLGQRIAPRDILHLRGVTEHQKGLGTRSDVDRLQASLTWSHLTDSKDLLSLGLTVLDSDSTGETLNYRQVALDLGYRLGAPVKGVSLDLGLGLTHRMHPDFPFMRDGQSDTSADAHLSATFSQVDYFGYVPVVTLNARKSIADVPLYESESLGVSVGLRSAF
ncbi:hypothetical protein BFP70_15815 [Thioclava sp. SK-1]|uniref:tetratricopeptide repeat protein n=1 Tax=Thioclava sp. SK-1 TaxID=1889770 RepID=UPI0008257FB0|nr:tetratricopeptide repeat protein [Thioclava sp. SK-1]OCX60939.1 hypothetical protein BFP70_15815 [Thioclava sp. SK-1]